MKLKKSKSKAIPVKVVNDTLTVGVTAKPNLLTLFEAREVPPGGHALGPLGGLNLTGYSEYRLTLHLVGAPGTSFQVRELFGPAGAVDQVVFDVGDGQIGPQGVLNYRARFDIFGPRNLFIQIVNNGDEAFLVNGTLYALL
ncbi:MAG: hypothetical protein H6953_06475 [Chromatiaceae bacterium]|nr:hypothetical protein [Gammaproteobacteria bacterium]MCP5305073.1 hypothetical protein [Chromatiaceae bacterium]MCP5315032.1 hypothetical protein [Chromatiaceae bacterium]